MSKTVLTKKMQENLLAQFLRQAEMAAIRAGEENGEDGGTCNRDAVLLYASRKGALVRAAARRIGLETWTTSHMGRQHHYVQFTLYGQGNLRSRMMTAAYRVLRAREETLSTMGITPVGYYAMD